MPPDSRTIPVSLTMRRVSIAPHAVDGGCCLACGAYLEFHQPQLGFPDRLVGVCGPCGRWYLVDIAPGLDEALLILLPDRGRLDDAFGG